MAQMQESKKGRLRAVHKRRHFSTSDRRKLLKQRQLARCENPSMAGVIDRNIQAIEEHRREMEESKTTQDRIADFITRFAGSMPFVYFHGILFFVWIVSNFGIAGLPQFDPFPFGLLTTIVSLEAIFLSTFVLVSQNRQALLAERQSELDLQINLLAEYEVTRILTLVDGIAKRLSVEECDHAELQDLKKDVKPEAVLQKLETGSAQSKSQNKTI